MRVLIIGGGGYIGYHIGLELQLRHHVITLFDLYPPSAGWERPSQSPLAFVKGNILSSSDLEHALTLSKAEGVIHCASYGMSSSEQLPSAHDHTESINITGTSLLLQACSSHGVTCFVHTSTFNVIFGSEEIIGGDESLPYFPLHRHWDVYSSTKSVAERLVLAFNSKHSTLHTCSLRLAGVMGVGETRHLPRIVASLPYLKFRYGSATVQFVGVDNVVQAHVKALEKLATHPNLIGGQAYFISDGEPVSHWEYLRPLIEGLGYTYPKLVLPVWVMWVFVLACQLFLKIGVWLGYSKWLPAGGLLLSPAELLKTSVTHWFKVDKARTHFNYIPENSNDLSDVVEEYRIKTGLSNNQETLNNKVQ